MTTKKRALKALLILASVLLLCMFFARTVQTITTAKVQKIQATRGRLEDQIPVKGEIYFSQGEPIIIEDARKLNITIDKVMARPGYLIKPGDALFTATLPTFDDEVAKIKTDYDKKVRELTVEYAGRIRLPQTSEHNEIYNQLLRATDNYYDKLYLAQAAAVAAGTTLPDDITAWGKPSAAVAPQAEVKPAAGEGKQKLAQDPQADSKAPAPTQAPAEASPAPDTSSEATQSPAPQPTKTPTELQQEKAQAAFEQARQEAIDAYAAKEAATLALGNVYRGVGPVVRTGDGIFDYIKKIDGMREDINKLSQQMLALDELKLGLQTIRAPREGYLMDFSLKSGDKYDGSKAAYSLSMPGETPILRCDVTDVKKPLGKGMKVKLDGSEYELSISEIQIAADRKKYALIELSPEAISALGGLDKLMSGPQSLTITYRAQRSTTLIPASALRSGGQDSYYVFVVQQSYGGMLSNTTFTVKKQDVKVIETSAKLASLEDDLSYVEIADREDRALTDGQAVMEYVD